MDLKRVFTASAIGGVVTGLVAGAVMQDWSAGFNAVSFLGTGGAMFLSTVIGTTCGAAIGKVLDRGAEGLNAFGPLAGAVAGLIVGVGVGCYAAGVVDDALENSQQANVSLQMQMLKTPTAKM
jgi:hypothetical protein